MDTSEPRASASRLRAWMSGVGLTLVSAVFAVAAFLLGASAGRAGGAERLWLLAGGAVCVAAGVFATWWQRRQDTALVQTAREIAEEAQEAFGLTLNGALAPLTSYLGEMAIAVTTADRREVGGRLAQAAVDAAVRVTAVNSRSAFYRLDPRGRHLVREAFAGRPTPPRPSFDAGTSDGNFVLDLVRSGELLVVEDVAQHPFVTPGPRGGYATVIAASVTAGPERLGLLTVDAPEVGDLVATDVDVVRVLANLLGAGLAGAQR